MASSLNTAARLLPDTFQHMKKLLLTAALLTGCATNPATGKRELSPATAAAIDHFTAAAITAGEAVTLSRLNRLAVHPGK